MKERDYFFIRGFAHIFAGTYAPKFLQISTKGFNKLSNENIPNGILDSAKSYIYICIARELGQTLLLDNHDFQQQQLMFDAVGIGAFMGIEKVKSFELT